jgi:phage shock protein PspC (stress-responsive transcriptional regulator)
MDGAGSVTHDGGMTNTTRTRTTPDRRLERSREDRVVAGVAGGLGTHLGISAGWVRLAFIILAFFGGLGFVVYAAAWLVIPDAGEKDPVVNHWLSRLDMTDGGMIFGVILVAAAAIIVMTKVISIPGTLVLAVVLFVLGLLLYRGDLTTGRGPGTRTPDDDGDIVPTGADGGEDAAPMSDDPDDPDGSSFPSAPVPAEQASSPPEPTDHAMAVSASRRPRAARPRRERSILGRLTVALDLIVLATMAMVDIAFAGVEIEPVAYVATGVAILGVGLLVGAWVGRARWLIVIGILALPALWFTALWPSHVTWTAGEYTYAPDAVADVDSPYVLGFGSMTIDLTGLTPDELEAIGTLDASVGAGRLVVILPDDTGADLTASVGVGSVEGPFADANGFGIDITRTVLPLAGGDGNAVLDLDLEVGAGLVEIQQVFGFARSNG